MANKESYRNVRTAKYTQVSNSFLNDKEASLQAKGLLSIFLSNSDDWEIHMAEIINRSKNGRDAHYTTVNELINLGYFARITVVGVNNRFEEMLYLFSDIKNDVEVEIDRLKSWANEEGKKLTIEFRGEKEQFPKKEKVLRNLENTPFPGNQDTEKTDAESQYNNNTKGKNTKNKNTNTINTYIDNIDDDKRTSSASHNDESINLIISNFREATKGELTDRSFNSVVRKVIDKYNQGKVNSFRDYLATALVRKVEELELRRIKESVKKKISSPSPVTIANKLNHMQLEEVPFYNWLEE